MTGFVTVDDVIAITGKDYSKAELERIVTIIPLLSDALRMEATKVGKDLDAMVETSRAYASVVKLVITDIVIRVMRQTMDGEPMSQESQGALGYTWSGTYAVPGGGIAAAIMRNDLKRLGLRRQRMSMVDLRGDAYEQT